MRENKESWIPVLLGALSIILFLVLIVWWIVAQWNECRTMGLSIFYCLKHVL